MRPLIVWLLLASLAGAQERSIVCIKLPNGNHRDDMGNIKGKVATAGTGSIVKIDRESKCPDIGFGQWVKAKILTAAHVVDGDEPFNCFLRDGEETRMRVISKGSIQKDDIALCEAYIPAKYEALPVCCDDTELLDQVTAHGLSGLVPKWPIDARRIDGKRIGRQWLDGRAYYDLIVKPGDSGGPILVDGKLVGVVSGGLMVNHPFGEQYFNTWPLVSVTPSRLREIVK